MNVSNGTPGQNGNIPGGYNPQGQPVQGPHQSMQNAQQPNLTKPNSQMGNMSQDMNGMVQSMNNMSQNNAGYQQNYQQGYSQYGQQMNSGYTQQMGYGAAGMGAVNGYTQQVYPVMPVKSTLGLVGMILSILSLICCGPILAIPGAICSIIALVKYRGDKRGLIGIIVAVISVLLWVVLWFTGLVSLSSLSFTDFGGNNYDIIEDADDSHIYDEDDYYYDEEDEDSDEDYTSEDDSDNGYIVEEESETEDDDEAETNSGNVGTDVATDFHPSSVVYNGITLNMGEYTASELEKVLGYEFDDEDMNYVLNPGYYAYTTYWVEVQPHDRIIYFYFANDTEEAIPMSDCKLYRVNFYSSDYFNGDTLADWLNVDLGSGITLDSTWDEIEDILGEPDYVYDNPEYGTHEIEYYKMYDYEYKVEFSYKDGVMTELTIGYY